MTNLEEKALPAIAKIIDYDEETLYAELGKRLKAIQAIPEDSGNFDLVIEDSTEAFGFFDDLKIFGRSFFESVNKQAYSLMCGKDGDNTKERNQLLAAFGLGAETLAAALAALLVAHFAIAPAIAAVVAALVIKLFFNPTHSAMCKVWESKL